MNPIKWMKKMGYRIWRAGVQVAKDPKTLLMGLVVGGFSAIASAHAVGEPLDMSATGTAVAGYVATTAAAGLPVFAGLFGLRVIVRAFHSVAG